MLALAIRLSVGPLTIDDAYITFRYARNIANGVGFVNNPGEHVLGTTTPLWALLLAAFYGIGLTALPTISVAISSLADAISVFLIWRLAARLGCRTRWALLAIVLFAISPIGLAHAASGMESSLFTTIVVASLLAHVDRRPTASALLAGVATVVRPEGLLLGALVLGTAALTCRLTLKSVVAYGTPVLAWCAFALWQFGSPVPQSVAAKTVVYRMSGMDNVRMLFFNPELPLFAFALVGWILVPRCVRLLGKDLSYLPVIAFAPALVLGYTWIGFRSVMLFPWYVVPLIPFFALAVSATLARWTARVPLAVQCALALVLLVQPASALNLGSDPRLPYLAPKSVDLRREVQFTAAADALRDKIGSDAVVALPEIGAFGYACDCRVLDTAGLVSPEAISFYPIRELTVANNAIPPDLIHTRRPAFLVGLDVYFGPLLEEYWFANDYVLYQSYPLRIWGITQALVVYQRLR